ncbi:hypothetical protein FB480_102592 [Agrobacterium vitis]|nr:hypothetical protein FB480_102592 [Agrobacterium vitis]
MTTKNKPGSPGFFLFIFPLLSKRCPVLCVSYLAQDAIPLRQRYQPYFSRLQSFGVSFGAALKILQRRAPYMALEGRCNTFNLLHNFHLKSIPI